MVIPDILRAWKTRLKLKRFRARLAVLFPGTPVIERAGARSPISHGKLSPPRDSRIPRDRRAALNLRISEDPNMALFLIIGGLVIMFSILVYDRWKYERSR